MLAYSLGRTLAYLCLGVLAGILAELLRLQPTIWQVWQIIAGVLLILFGLSLMGKIRFLNSVEISLDRFGWFKQTFTRALQTKTAMGFLRLGFLNGFLPCGLAYFFLVTAMSLDSIVEAVVAMGVLGITSSLSLHLLGSGQFRPSQSIRTRLNLLAGGSMILLGLLTFR